MAKDKNLTDLEITILCSRAMEFTHLTNYQHFGEDGKQKPPITISENFPTLYDPLHDDAQAMALARKFPYEFEQSVIKWCNHLRCGELFDLNHLFCERIAHRES